MHCFVQEQGPPLFLTPCCDERHLHEAFSPLLMLLYYSTTTMTGDEVMNTAASISTSFLKFLPVGHGDWDTGTAQSPLTPLALLSPLPAADSSRGYDPLPDVHAAEVGVTQATHAALFKDTFAEATLLYLKLTTKFWYRQPAPPFGPSSLVRCP